LRKPEMLPPAEIREALAEIVEVHLGVVRDEAVIEASRLFGIKATSPQLRRVVEEQMQLLLESGRLEERNGKLYVPQSRPNSAGQIS
jgi:hypothetical protein